MATENEAVAVVDAPLPASTALAGLTNSDMMAAGFDEKDYANFASSVEFLPRLQLCGASSNLCKEGKIAVGSYALVQDKERFKDLGKQTNVFIVGLRLKALEIIEGTTPAAGIFSFFDPKSPEFQRVASLSLEKDTGCLAGPEFLVYLSKEKQFATFFMASKSMRNEAPSIKALLGKACTLTIALAENKKKQKWHVPKALPCSIPLDQPTGDELAAQLLRFKNPVSSNVKKAPDAPTGTPVTAGSERPS